jgi:hypothetical protein
MRTRFCITISAGIVLSVGTAASSSKPHDITFSVNPVLGAIETALRD